MSERIRILHEHGYSPDDDVLIARGYTRLSDDSDRSIPRQRENITEYVDHLNERDDQPTVILDTIYNDGKWTSGFSSEGRVEYLSLVNDIENQTIDLAIADGQKRFVRDVDDSIDFFRISRDNEVELHDAETWRKLDVERPTELAFQIFQSAVEHEALQRYIRKAKKETRKRIDNGYYHGQPPAGLKYDNNKQYLVAGDDFDSALQVIELREQGASYATIEEKTGWTAPAIQKILKRREKYEAVQQGKSLGHQLAIIEPTVVCE